MADSQVREFKRYRDIGSIFFEAKEESWTAIDRLPDQELLSHDGRYAEDLALRVVRILGRLK